MELEHNRMNTVCEWSNSRIRKKQTMNVTFQDVVQQTEFQYLPSHSQCWNICLTDQVIITTVPLFQAYSQTKSGKEICRASPIEGTNISEATIGVLNNEAIHTFQVLQLLQEEHVRKLLDKLSLGQHILLTEIFYFFMYTSFKHRSEQRETHLSRGYYQRCPNTTRENTRGKRQKIKTQDKDLQLTKLNINQLQSPLKRGKTRGTNNNWG